MKTYQMMHTEVIAVTVDTPVDDIIQRLADYRLNSLPVIDTNGYLIGLVSQHDLFSHAAGMRDSSDTFARMTASDVMTHDVIAVAEEEDISEVAWLVARYCADILPVVRDNRLVGVILRTDLIRLYAIAG